MDAPPVKRRKRAAVDQLYKTCKMGGDCPPDVVPKVEGDTVADRILKWLSSFFYFGNLGISTGRGTGGRLGYTPLGGGGGHAAEGGGVRVGAPISTLGVGVDAVGPAEAVPVDVLQPSAPSIIPLGEGVSVDTVDVIAEVLPPPGGARPEVTAEVPGQPATIDVAMDVVPRLRAAVSRSTFHNPAFQVELQSLGTGESSASEQAFVFGHAGGRLVDTVGEDIEMVALGDGVPRTSTPRSSSATPRSRLWGRRFEQVQVADPAFLSAPDTLVQYGFSNPAYDPEASLVFPYTEGEARAAPSTLFQDVAYLGRPEITSHKESIGVSRLGRRATVQTRSGTIIGAEVHFRYELSPITSEDIELSVLTTQDEEALSVVDLESLTSAYSERELLEDDQPNIHGVLSFTDEEGATTSLPLAPPQARFFYTGPFLQGGRGVSDGRGQAAGESSHPGTDVIIEYPEAGGSYFLHPTAPCRRKRRYCFADGLLDAGQSEVLSPPCACY
ncbi:L2 [Equus caballus papillomavirus 5]|uniref:Minor capsid protein L2 n=1 Tax=Equus caballus papillomavirus 5 TaxID=1235429 RepID=K9M8S9_9PAPI|nr:L2 [Equus caballus papillomavirus 5]AFS89117.1 L2 [Equus caballus papillomavirus 5]